MWHLHHNVKTSAILDFKIFPKRQKIAQNYWKILKTNKHVLKIRKKEKPIALNLFSLIETRKLQIWEKMPVKMALAMVTSR